MGKSKPTCIIHAPVNSPDECKVLGDFGFKYTKSRPTKEYSNNTLARNKFTRQQEKNDNVNSAVNESL